MGLSGKQIFTDTTTEKHKCVDHLPRNTETQGSNPVTGEYIVGLMTNLY